MPANADTENNTRVLPTLMALRIRFPTSGPGARRLLITCLLILKLPDVFSFSERVMRITRRSGRGSR